MSAAHVADYHLFKVESAIEFVSLSVQIVKWINEYQEKLFNGIMKDKASSTSSSTVGKKRDRESDDDDPDGDTKPKRQQSKQTKIETATEPASRIHVGNPPAEQLQTGAGESSMADAAGKYIPGSPQYCEYQDPTDQKVCSSDYLDVPPIVRTSSLQFLEIGVAVIVG